MRATVVTLRAFSKEWWCAWIHDVEAGRAVGFVADQARRGKGWVIRSDQRPMALEVAALVPVEVDSEAFAAWAGWFERRHGTRLPKPDVAKVILGGSNAEFIEAREAYVRAKGQQA